MDLVNGMEADSKALKSEIYRLSWSMRGGVSSHELFHVYSHEDRLLLAEIIEQNIENYKIICNIYLVLKTIIIYYHPKQFILDICKIFCYIIDIFDLISDNTNKIKKISYDSSFIINKYFLELYSHNIYLKKTGFVKKDIM